MGFGYAVNGRLKGGLYQYTKDIPGCE